MTVEEFEATLRDIVRHEPFQPFVVEMTDGRVLTVDRPVVFDGGSASYLTWEYDLVEFACEKVRAIRRAVAETKP